MRGAARNRVAPKLHARKLLKESKQKPVTKQFRCSSTPILKCYPPHQQQYQQPLHDAIRGIITPLSPANSEFEFESEFAYRLHQYTIVFATHRVNKISLACFALYLAPYTPNSCL